MEWIIVFCTLIFAWYFFQRNFGDKSLKRVRALTFILERYGAALHGVDNDAFQRVVNITTKLRIGIHALKSNQAFLLDDEVLAIYKDVATDDDFIYTLLKNIDTAKISEFKYAFRNCYERLSVLYRPGSSVKGHNVPGGDDELYDAMCRMCAEGVDADELPNGVGQFGLTPSNPIPCRTILGSSAYLDRLYTAGGVKVNSQRSGSVTSDVVKYPVDEYFITHPNGERLATIYISPYQKRNSSQAPAGFVVAWNGLVLDEDELEGDDVPSERPSACPSCGLSEFAWIIYGYPEFSEKLNRDISQGEVVLGGCIPSCSKWQCTSCGQRIPEDDGL